MPQKGEEQPLVHFPRDLETVEVGLELPKLSMSSVSFFFFFLNDDATDWSTVGWNSTIG